MTLKQRLTDTPLHPVRIPTRAQVPVSEDLMRRIAEARAALDKRGVDVKSDRLVQ